MTARRGPRSGRCYRREPLARQPSLGCAGLGSVLRHCRRRTSESRRCEMLGVPGSGWRALTGGRHAEMPRRRRPPKGRGLPPAGRVDGANAHLRLRAAGVCLRPCREEAEELGRLGRDRGAPVRRGEALPVPEGRYVVVPCGACAPANRVATSDAGEEILRWLGNLCRVNGQPFCLCPFPARIDSRLFTNASETGAGAVISVKGPDAAGGRLMPLSMPHDELVQRARRGIEFATAFPPLGRDVRYIRRELWGVLAFIMSAAAAPSSRDTYRVVM